MSLNEKYHYIIRNEGCHAQYDFSRVPDTDLTESVNEAFEECRQFNYNPSFGLENDYFHLECDRLVASVLKRVGLSAIAESYIKQSVDFWYD